MWHKRVSTKEYFDERIKTAINIEEYLGKESIF